MGDEAYVQLRKRKRVQLGKKLRVKKGPPKNEQNLAPEINRIKSNRGTKPMFSLERKNLFSFGRITKTWHKISL